MDLNLSEFLQAHNIIGYFVIFIAMIIEGDLVLFTAAFLTHQGFFDPFKMLVTVFSGSISGDLFWYWLGLKLNGSSKFTAWASRMAAPFDDHLIQRPLHTIFLSKFIYGFHHAILIRAGMLKTRFDKFLRIDLISIVGWMLIVGGLGYASSCSIRYIQFSLMFVVIAYIVLSYVFSYGAKKKL